MYECRIGIKIIWCHRSTTTITTMADHSRRWRKCPPNAPHEALRPAPSSSLDGWWPPEQADTIFKGLRGCMALIHTPMLRWCIIAGTNERFEGHTPPQHPQHYIRLLGGSSPINLTRWNEAQCLVWGITGAFPPSAAMVVTVFYSLPEHEPLFPVVPRHSGNRQKALVSSKTILAL
jgi:hypothetical protein